MAMPAMALVLRLKFVVEPVVLLDEAGELAGDEEPEAEDEEQVLAEVYGVLEIASFKELELAVA